MCNSGHNKEDPTKERSYGHLAVQGSCATPFIAFREEKESEQRPALLSAESVMHDKIEKLIPLLGKLATLASQKFQSRPSRPKMYYDRCRPLINFNRGYGRYNEKDRN